MEEKNIDVRGVSCPFPVMRTRELLKEAGEGEMVVEVAYLFAGDYVGQNRVLGKVLLKGFLDALVEVKARKKM